MEDLLEVDDVIGELDSISISNHNSRCGLSFQKVQKIKKKLITDEQQQIYYLVESHVPNLREKISMRYERIIMGGECDEETTSQLKHFKSIIGTKCMPEIDVEIEAMIKQVAEMPKEWTIIQLTSKFNPLEIHNIDEKKYQTKGLHISVFNCGQSDVKPLLVTVDATEINGNKIDLLQKLMDMLSENRERMTSISGKKMFKNRKEKIDYLTKREESEQMLMEVVKNVSDNWLREWRCLLIGKYQDESIEDFINQELNIVIKNELGDIEIPPQYKMILRQITKGIKYLRKAEVFNAVKYCLGNICNQNKVKEVCRLISEIDVKVNMQYEKILRHPVILIIDETLDAVPWEMLDILDNEPVSRMPSLHFAYFLFKVHEKDIEGGHKIIRNYENGSYVVNPDRDLVDMESRMMSFYKYWLPDWSGISDRKPTKDEFFDLLTKADIFTYNGHGNGAHIMNLEVLQRTYVKAVVLLFGCSSTRMNQLSPQAEIYGSYHIYLISRCPCVVGMLWEVTDVDTDVLTTEFLSNWIPSDAPISWNNVNKTQWKKAVKCDTFSAVQQAEGDRINNLELSRALWHSKKSATYFLTRAACVVRGLPVKIRLS